MENPSVMTNLSVKKHHQHNPPLAEVCKVLEDGLKKSFTHVKVSIVDCPNLTQKPFDLVCEGLCGQPRIIEVGGEANLFPLPKKEKLYDIKNIAKLSEVHSPCVIGAAAGPWVYNGENCEIISNLRIEGNDVNSRIRLLRANVEKKTCTMEFLPNTETRFAFMGNFFVSEGKPGKVLEILCKTRTGSDDFISCIRKTLQTHYKSNSIALGGVFLLEGSKANHHIMPSSFSSVPIKTRQELDSWLYCYTQSPPIVAVGTIISFDPGLNVRPAHFHGFGLETGGHFRAETDPSQADFKGYFSLGEEILRVDSPLNPKWWVD